MEQELARAPGSLLQAWQLLSSCSALLVLTLIAGGLMWRMRAEAKVLVNRREDLVPPVLQRLGRDSDCGFEHTDDAKPKAACLASFKKPVADPQRRVVNGD